MTDERIGDLTHQEVEKIVRAALRLGEAMAQRRAASLASEGRRSMEHAERLRRALGEERDVAQRLYRRALDTRFWDDPNTSVDDVTAVVQAAKQFAPWDPEAALAARECERHAGLTVEAEQVAARAQAVDELEHIEEVQAREASKGEETPRVQAESADAVSSSAAWDSAQARAEWLASKQDATTDVHAFHGVLLADASLHQPARKALAASKTTRGKSNVLSGYRANKMRQKRAQTL